MCPHSQHRLAKSTLTIASCLLSTTDAATGFCGSAAAAVVCWFVATAVLSSGGASVSASVIVSIPAPAVLATTGADAASVAAAVPATGGGDDISLSAALMGAAVVPSVYWIQYLFPRVVNETTVP